MTCGSEALPRMCPLGPAIVTTAHHHSIKCTTDVSTGQHLSGGLSHAVYDDISRRVVVYLSSVTIPRNTLPCDGYWPV